MAGEFKGIYKLAVLQLLGGKLPTLTSGMTLSESETQQPNDGESYIYLRDDGSGKMQLCVRFPSGADQIIATEP